MPRALFLCLSVFLCASVLRAQNLLVEQQLGIPQTQEQIKLTFAPLVKASVPAVVNIYTTRFINARTSSPFMRDPFFREFFEGYFGHLSEQRQRKVQNSLGSGVIIDNDGFIVTNHHVIEGADEIHVVLSDESEYNAQVIYSDDKKDLAVLSLQFEGEKPPLTSLQIADSDTLEVGDLVLAIGNPFGVGQTVTSGIISAKARAASGISDFNFFIQTDAAINPGNSGGALVDMSGKLVGINSAIFSRSGGSNGIGFAIPSNLVRGFFNSVAQSKSGKPLLPWLGIKGQNLTPELADAIGVAKEARAGLVITRIHPQSPLRTMDAKPGDVVVSLNNKPIRDYIAMRYRLAERAVGDKINLGLIADGQLRTLELTLAAPPQSEGISTKIKGNNPLGGAYVVELSPAKAAQLGLGDIWEGVVIEEVEPGSNAALIGFRAGDIVTELQGINIPKVTILQEVLSENKNRNWYIILERDGQRREVQLYL